MTLACYFPCHVLILTVYTDILSLGFTFLRKNLSLFRRDLELEAELRVIYRYQSYLEVIYRYIAELPGTPGSWVSKVIDKQTRVGLNRLYSRHLNKEHVLPCT